VFAAEGFDLVILARREARLHAVQSRLSEKYGVRVDVMAEDLEDPAAPARISADLEARGLKIDALVNNAGYGVPGSYIASGWDVHERFLQIMVVAVAELTHRLLPGMIERRYGRIINVASLAGLVPAPAGHALYGASKAFLIKMSEALAHEGRPHGVHVTALCPGFTRSEFHDVTGTREQMKGMPSWMWLDAATVARQGYDAVMAGEPMRITGGVNKSVALAVRYVPQWLVRMVSGRMAKSYRKT